MRYSITLKMSAQEWKILEAALSEAIDSRESESRFVREDCSCGAVELKHEANVLRTMKNDANRQVIAAMKKI